MTTFSHLNHDTIACIYDIISWDLDNLKSYNLGDGGPSSTLSLINKLSYTIINRLYKGYWLCLPDSIPSVSPVVISDVMVCILPFNEIDNVEKTRSLFKQLIDKLDNGGAARPKHLSPVPAFFKKRFQDIQRENDRALVFIWTKINEQLPLEAKNDKLALEAKKRIQPSPLEAENNNTLQIADGIRKHIDSLEEKHLLVIENLSLEDLSVTVIPPELIKFSNLKRVAISDNWRITIPNSLTKLNLILDIKQVT
jgi:hypothetical protein